MKRSIGDIKSIFESFNIVDIHDIINLYKDDDRKGVQKLIQSYEKKYASYIGEMNRLDEISVFEKKYYNMGKKLIAGIDEVGRGPLAGPVVAAAVILPENCKIVGVNDSKKLSAKKREQLFYEIKERALAVGVGVVSNIVIDEINILQATYKAMRGALCNLDVMPDCILADAVTIPEVDICQEAIVKGDEKSISIGAASIIAKVTRDAMMDEFSRVYVGYSFEKNKGYGSAEHIAAIKKLGLCPIHRRSFTKKF